MDLLQYVGARSVTVPSEFVSPQLTTNQGRRKRAALAAPLFLEI